MQLRHGAMQPGRQRDQSSFLGLHGGQFSAVPDAGIGHGPSAISFRVHEVLFAKLKRSANLILHHDCDDLDFDTFFIETDLPPALPRNPGHVRDLR